MISNNIPLGRLGTPDEVAKAVRFSHPATAATARERNCFWMAASRKCRPAFRDHEVNAGQGWKTEKE
jgi:hypothetical protein